MACRGIWQPLRKAFFDIRITHPNAPSNRNRSLKQILLSNEQQKKTAYNARIIEIEHASFTPLVYTTNGAMGPEADRLHKTLCDKLAQKTNCSYSDTMNYVRKRMSFTILRTALISVRGKRKNGRAAAAPLAEVDFNLVSDL